MWGKNGRIGRHTKRVLNRYIDPNVDKVNSECQVGNMVDDWDLKEFLREDGKNRGLTERKMR